MGKEQDSGAFDDSDAGCAFAGEVLEGTALFFGEFDWVRFFSHSLVYSSVRRCTEDGLECTCEHH
jgi:hypothetical protein